MADWKSRAKKVVDTAPVTRGGGATPDHTRPADWLADAADDPLPAPDDYADQNLGVAPVAPPNAARADAPAAKPAWQARAKRVENAPLVPPDAAARTHAPFDDPNAGDAQKRAEFEALRADGRAGTAGDLAANRASHADELAKEYEHKYGSGDFGGGRAFAGGTAEGVFGPEGAARVMGVLPGSSTDQEALRNEINAVKHPAPTGIGRTFGTLSGFAVGNRGPLGAKMLKNGLAGAFPGVVSGDAQRAGEGLLMGGLLTGAGALKAAPEAGRLAKLGAWAANRVPAAAAVGGGATQAYQGFKRGDQAAGWQGLSTAFLPAALAAGTHIGQRGGAAEITPLRQQAEADTLALAGREARGEVTKEAESARDLVRQAQVEHQSAYEQRLAEAKRTAETVHETAAQAEARERQHAIELLEAQKAQAQDYEDRRRIARELADLQRQEFVQRDEAYLKGAKDLNANIEHAARNQQREQVARDLAAARAEHAKSRAAAKPAGPTPEASARGLHGQVYGEAGTRLSHVLDAIDRGVLPDDPAIRELYEHVLQTLDKNNPRALAEMKRIREIGDEAWLKEKEAEFAAKQAAPPPAPRPTRADITARPVDRTALAESLESGYPDAPKPDQILSDQSIRTSEPWIEGAPDAHHVPRPVDPRALPRKPFVAHMKDAGEASVPDFRALEANRPNPGEAGPPKGRIEQLVNEFAKKKAAQMQAEAPDNVRARMTYARVPPTRSIPKQYNLENPRLRLSNLLPTARGRRLASDLGTGESSHRGSPIESFLHEGTPAEAAHIAREVEAARGKVDARRESARAANAGAAAGSMLDPYDDPDFRAWLKAKEASLKGGGR